jgi:hypothetical protein
MVAIEGRGGEPAEARTVLHYPKPTSIAYPGISVSTHLYLEVAAQVTRVTETAH